MSLPNGKIVDILSAVFEEMVRWLQIDETAQEAGGYIVGYQHKNTGNVSLENISHPYQQDVRNRIRFGLRDPKHNLFLLNSRKKNSYYLGVWHTHPQLIPEPSNIDWDDWYGTLETDKTACEYVFFIIAGTVGARVWVGNLKTMEITEILEFEKEGNFYKKA